MNYSDSELRQRFDAVKPWHHMISVRGVPTKVEPAWGEPLEHPKRLWESIEPLLPDLHEQRLLDVGCNDGFFVFECAKRGAASVVGIEASGHFFKHAQLVKEVLELTQVEIRNISAYSIDESLGLFDVSLLLGLIYHLKNPLLVLDKVSSITKSMIVVETAIRNSSTDLSNRDLGKVGQPCMEFIEHPFAPFSDTAALLGTGVASARYEGAPNWWAPNTECVCAMLRSCGFKHTRIVSECNLEPEQVRNVFGRAIVIGQK